MIINFDYSVQKCCDKKEIVHTHTKFAEKSLGERLMYSNEFQVYIALYTKRSVSVDIIVDGMEYHIRQLGNLSCGGKYRCVGDDKRGYYFKMDKHQTVRDLDEVIYRIVHSVTNETDNTYKCNIVFDSSETADVCGLPTDGKYVVLLSRLDNERKEVQR